LQESAREQAIDEILLMRFQEGIGRRLPHLVDTVDGRMVVNATPLVDLTPPLLEWAKAEYGTSLPAGGGVRVFGKLDSRILGGSIKARPAFRIIENAIASGELVSGKPVFEATSGNFGIALGLLRELGLEIVVLVSRKLQEGVLEELRRSGVKMINLDIDICPAPGLNIDQNLLVARGIASNVRDQLVQLGFDGGVFDQARTEIEELLARQNAIDLAKLFARIYGGFCPSQYDNELNLGAHETVTGPEIDQQLREQMFALGDFQVITAFGTGGTSAGLDRYVQETYGTKAVRVVFPLANQDVAGIRTREKVVGLRFYNPDRYLGQHEVDFDVARRLLRFLASRGYDVGESSALVLLACVQLLNLGVGEKFVVILSDGLSKYQQGLVAEPRSVLRLEVTLDEAISSGKEYDEVIWTHPSFSPKEEGVRFIASRLGTSPQKVKVAGALDVLESLMTQELTDGLRETLPKEGSRVLLVCMAGGTSLQMAKLLSKYNVKAESLTGGIVNMSSREHRALPDLLQVARD
jgi:cysteine synthase A